MKEALICTYDPLFSKCLDPVLRDEGYERIDIAEHTAQAVQKAMIKHYEVILMDSATIGLSASDAAKIISNVKSDAKIIIAGNTDPTSGVYMINKPLDLEEAKKAICSINAV